MAKHFQTLRLTALSDLVVSARHGTEGGHACLDYLPGSVLLGPSVGAWLRSGKGFDPTLFLSGRVRFNNAYPCGTDESRFQPSVPMPLAFHGPKENKTEIINGVLASLYPKDNREHRQLKQKRKDFLAIAAGGTARLSFVSTQHTSRMKTAIDRGGYGRSKDKQLFDYQAIQAGQSFLCTVEADETIDAAVFAEVIEGLCHSTIRVGRSRSAEFGKLKVEKVGETDPPVSREAEAGEVVLYLASDLVLMREGSPVLLPTATDFGLPDTYALDLKRTFIRTRAFSPWIQYRDGYDIERQAICQGSVITFVGTTQDRTATNDLRAHLAGGWGLHRAEGCGRVLVNPDFLLSWERGEVETFEARSMDVHRERVVPPTALTRLLLDRHEAKTLSLQAQPLANQWAQTVLAMMKRVEAEVGECPGKTQWSNVRSIASSGATAEQVRAALKELFANSRRQTMWSEEVFFNNPRRTAEGRRISLGEFLIGRGVEVIWGTEWFKEATSWVTDKHRPRLWCLLIALTATAVIRTLNKTESSKEKEPTHV